MKTRGFTLIEVLITVAIIAGLIGIGYSVSRSFLGKSREAACLNNLRSLGVGLQTYLQEHNDIMPTLEAGRASKSEDLQVLDTILLPYFETPEAFHCPADKEQFAANGCSYSWNSYQSGRHVSNLFFFGIRPESIPLIFDKESWHPSGTNFLYADLSSSNKPRFAAGSGKPD